MKTVLVRVTGRRSAEDDPALAPLVANARRYVQQYRGGADNQVWVSFDGPAIERWLTQNGQPLWGHERPTTFVWLTCPGGPSVRIRHHRRQTPPNLKSAIDAEAARRGLPLLWPSAADLQKKSSGLRHRERCRAVDVGRDRPARGRRRGAHRSG